MHKRRLFLFSVLGIQILSTFFFASSLMDIKYSYIGDEYTTYQYAKLIATGTAAPNALSLNGVFGENPVLGSYYQAAVMKVFGTDIYGWKLSSILIIFPLGFLMFALVKRIANVPTAFFALLATNFSFFLYNFFQIGYLNNLSLLCLVSIMYLVTFIDPKRTNQSSLPYVLLGIIVGLSWYFYIGKLFIVIVSLYLLIFLKAQRKYLRHFIMYLIPAFFLILLSLMNTPIGPSDFGLSKTILAKEFTDNKTIVTNIFYPFILQFYSPTQTHYIPRASYVDTITASLSTVGLLLLMLSVMLKKFRMHTAFHRYLLLFFLLSIIIGVTTPYTLPPITRGIHFVPLYIIFATYCLLYLTTLLGKQKIVVAVLFSTLTIMMIYLNHLEITKPLPMNTNQKLLLLLKNEPRADIVFIKSKNCINLVNLAIAVKSYNLPHTITLNTDLEKNYCSRKKLLFTCEQDVCGKKPEKTYEDKLYIYRL